MKSQVGEKINALVLRVERSKEARLSELEYGPRPSPEF